MLLTKFTISDILQQIFERSDVVAYKMKEVGKIICEGCKYKKYFHTSLIEQISLKHLT